MMDLRWILNHTNLSRTEFVLKASIKQIRIYRVDVEQTGGEQSQGRNELRVGNHGCKKVKMLINIYNVCVQGGVI